MIIFVNRLLGESINNMISVKIVGLLEDGHLFVIKNKDNLIGEDEFYFGSIDNLHLSWSMDIVGTNGDDTIIESKGLVVSSKENRGHTWF